MGTTESGATGRNKPLAYRCFLVRCRLAEAALPGGEVGGPAELGWRFTVQEAGRDGARRSFACLKDVEAYLEAELGASGKQALESAESGVPSP